MKIFPVHFKDKLPVIVECNGSNKDHKREYRVAHDGEWRMKFRTNRKNLTGKRCLAFQDYLVKIMYPQTYKKENRKHGDPNYPSWNFRRDQLNNRKHRTTHINNSSAFHQNELKPVRNTYVGIIIHYKEAGNNEQKTDFQQ
jgi:hypothetical protein